MAIGANRRPHVVYIKSNIAEVKREKTGLISSKFLGKAIRKVDGTIIGSVTDILTGHTGKIEIIEVEEKATGNITLLPIQRIEEMNNELILQDQPQTVK